MAYTEKPTSQEAETGGLPRIRSQPGYSVRPRPLKKLCLIFNLIYLESYPFLNFVCFNDVRGSIWIIEA